MEKIWNVKKFDEKDILYLKEKYKVSSLLAKLILAKNIKEDEIEDFFKADINKLEDPFKIKDMDKIVNAILTVKKNKGKICIYGDYDVDGITSITVFYLFLKEIGVDVCYYLPSRLKEGYGLNKEAILYIKNEIKANLIITVDCGITAIEEVKYAKEIGIDVCITDHHECLEILPLDAVAVVNPKRKDDTSTFKYHAGVGVAFKCIMALSKVLKLKEEKYLKYLDIVALGTISDIVSLRGENRIISKYGLQAMKVTKNIGLKALIDVIYVNDIDSNYVSFMLAPRINACGRLGDASIATELFLCNNKVKANKLAEQLDELNIKRQEIEKNIYEEAIKIIEECNLDSKASIVIYNEKWHNGVIGIVASKLVNIYNKPIVLFTKENGIIRGSSRCQEGFSLYNALVECKDLLIQFGGHELAAGMSIDEKNIEKFYDKFNRVVLKNSKDLPNGKIINIDAEILPLEITSRMYREMCLLKPYGQDNNEPLFLYKNARVQTISTICNEKHLKIVFKNSGITINGIGFYLGNLRDEFLIGDRVDVVCNLVVNNYQGVKTLQFIIKDIRKI